ncbi:MAG: histidinol-phosphatase [Methylococcales bacterium]|nr:histidinol-phosphatase [Methylococcales bacterium]
MTNNPFLCGSTWLRTDFHLHTRKDKEFSYQGKDNCFITDYIEALKQANIQIGVITNHNKFDLAEFKALRKRASAENIFLLPGVELSVGDGANGIHTLVVFSDEWIVDRDYVNPFLTMAFEGKTADEYEHENGRSSVGLIEIIKRLEAQHKDFFLVFAHVENNSGLWKEVNGGRLEEFGKNEFFRRRALGFQNVRSYDKPDKVCRKKVKDWLVDWYPAEVQGCDAKQISDIGLGKTCYLKLGAFTFEAVKFALLDHAQRVCCEVPTFKHSHIRSIRFEGAGALGGQTLSFSPELNTLIGIRGSGKSSILEAIRYALNIPFGDKSSDKEYKNNLVGYTLSSGGKITLQAVDKRGCAYEIRRIYGEQPDVFVDGKLQPGVSIRETVLHKPIYFGQKDLSSSGEGFEKDLIEKLLGEHLCDVRRKIDAQKVRVTDAIDQLKRWSRSHEQKTEWLQKKQNTEFQLKFYKDHGVEEKLQKQVDFDADDRKCGSLIGQVAEYLNALNELISQYEDELRNQLVYSSSQNQPFFSELFAIYRQLLDDFDSIKQASTRGQLALANLKQKIAEFGLSKESFKEEFAEIERKLAAELQQAGAQAISPQQFRQLKSTLDQAEQMLKALEQGEQQQKKLQEQLVGELISLNNSWLEEYRLIEQALQKINQPGSPLQIKPRFKGDKPAMLEYLKDLLRGSRIRESNLTSLVEQFSDFSAVYRELEQAKKLIGNNSAEIFEQYFMENLEALLTWQVPNTFIIEYRGKALKDHSLGQRASALILFILSQRDNDVVIIDQPEDDLDNQTIYEDVIKLVCSLKPQTQFIFATHNANIPVLGDAEQVIACQYNDDKIIAESGGIDCPAIQQHIVDIMEGGEEAFRQRKKVYEIWKPQNF